MRPASLNPYFSPLTTLNGVGPKQAKLMATALGVPDGHDPTLIDLLFHLPIGYTDRRYRPTIKDANIGELVTLEVVVHEHQLPSRNARSAPRKVLCSDDTSYITLVFFNARDDYLKRALPLGETRFLSGRIDEFRGEKQIVHPDFIASSEEFQKLPQIEARYRATQGLSSKQIAKAMALALSSITPLPEWIETELLNRSSWPDFLNAMEAIHRPSELEQIEPSGRFLTRLAYDEALANQLTSRLLSHYMQGQRGRALHPNNDLVDRMTSSLPYKLTTDQSSSFSDIRADMETPNRMVRLLQGDVGSGKTAVALIAMAHAVAAGTQAALMAPTEILARQHYQSISESADKLGLRVCLMIGALSAKEKRAALDEIASGQADIIIGTHALFQERVVFKDLGLAVIDEQHRFGVQQRLALTAKAQTGNADLLIMSATPIPRTLQLAYFGDMDVSSLREKPPGRTPIDTRAVANERMGELLEGIRRQVASGSQIYWVCPLVEESEEIEAVAAEDRFAALKSEFGDKVALLHGRMKAEEKASITADFRAGRYAILVATTVVEVGVDVPNATVIVIENAERFGLAQLHQLRGRVGRGSKPSTCILLYQPPLGEVSKARINILRETNDGFRLAEEDLRLRGGGEMFGTRQSGVPAFRFLSFEHHLALFEIAKKDAEFLLETDPMLQTERGDAAKHLLYLHRRDEAMNLVNAG